MYIENLRRFIRAESGAVTIDFVMITAAVVGLGIGVMVIIAPGIEIAASTIEPGIEAADGLAGRLFGTSN